MNAGQVPDGLAAADSVAQRNENPAVVWFDIACCYAVAIESLTDAESTEIYRRVAESVRYLAKAADAGFFDDAKNRAHVREDNDLQSLKTRPEFLEFCHEHEI